MPIHFACRHCRAPHTVDAVQAGSPLLCPTCRREVLVPTASETRARHATLVTGGPTPFATERQPGAARRQMHGAVAVLAALALLGGYLSNRQRQEEQDREEALALVRLLAPDPPVEVSPLRPTPAPAPVRPSAYSPLVMEARPEQPAPVEAPQAHLVAGGLLPPPRHEVEDVPREAVAKGAPAPGPVPKPEPPAQRKPDFVRRQRLSEPELVRQLGGLPEVGLTPHDVSAVTQRFATVFQATGGTNFEPTTLLAVRPDLVSLPIRDGSFSRLAMTEAVNLHVLAPKLHHYLDRAVARDPQGNRPDLDRLRDVLRNERRGQRPEWLRAEAVPTLLQILMHEDRPLRLLLVDLLAEIDGRTAAVALAQRAVFDLSADVREAAVQALANRPPRGYRHIFLYALRYPWAPAADHAAEALAALHDREAVPYLVSLLKEPDPAAPLPVRTQYFLRDVVKLRHTSNCLTCHPPAGTGSDPVPGAVPGQKLVRVSTQVRQNPTTIGSSPLVAASSIPGNGGGGLPSGGGGGALGGLADLYGGGGGGGGNSSITTTPPPSGLSLRQAGTTSVVRPGGQTVSRSVSEAPLLVRADITYVRQDFSLQLPVAHPAAPSGDRRFDYVVRTRQISAREALALLEKAEDRADYPQRQAVLFALRALTGEDAGRTTEAWANLFPTAEFDVKVAGWSDSLVDASSRRKEQLLLQMRDGKGVGYTLALAAAIPRLSGLDQVRARNALIERLMRMNADTLRDKLCDEHAEVRRAAAIACARKDSREHIPDVAALLEDPEPGVAESAGAALKRLTAGEVVRADAGDGQ